VDQRLQFLSSSQKEVMSVSDLCREFGVSRPTGYRWINRYKEVGPEGLLDLSSRPHSCSHATPERTENTILALRSKYPSWGARKLKARLEQLEPGVDWPAASTFGNILQRAGLTSPKTQEATHDSVLGAILRGDSTESALVHGFQRLFQHG
jgi:transposase